MRTISSSGAGAVPGRLSGSLSGRGRGVLRPVAAAAAAILLSALSAGCSSDKGLAKPVELTKIPDPVIVRAGWTVKLGSGDFLQPAVLAQAIFAAGGESLMRVDPRTGAVAWRVDTRMPLSAGVGSDGELVVVASARGDVLAYDSDGKPRWRAQASSDVIVAPLVGHGLVLVQSTDHRIAAFEIDSGKRRWTYQRQAPALALRAPVPLQFDGENVVAGFAGGRVVEVSLSNGAPRWEATVSEPRGSTEVERLADVIGTVALDGAGLCAASFQGRVACFDEGGANLRWARDLSAGAGVAADRERVYAVDQASTLSAYTRTAGAGLWKNDALANRTLSSPALSGRWVVAGDYKGVVHFFDAASGTLRGRAETDGSPIAVAPVPWGKGVIVQSRKGTLAYLVPGA